MELNPAPSELPSEIFDRLKESYAPKYQGLEPYYFQVMDDIYKLDQFKAWEGPKMQALLSHLREDENFSRKLGEKAKYAQTKEQKKELERIKELLGVEGSLPYPETIGQRFGRRIKTAARMGAFVGGGLAVGATGTLAAHSVLTDNEARAEVKNDNLAKKPELAITPTSTPQVSITRGDNEVRVAVSPATSPVSSPDVKPASSPEAVVSPEVRVGGDILKDILGPVFYKKALELRAQKANDPEWQKRVDSELNEGRVNFLLLGLGIETEQRSDAFIVASYLVNEGRLELIGMPRDLYTPNANGFLEKRGVSSDYMDINMSYPLGVQYSPDSKYTLASEIAEDATGLSVDFVSTVNFKGLIEVLGKTLGTIKINVDEDIRTTILDEDGSLFYLPPGEQEVTPEVFVKYLRTREHTENQREARAERGMNAFRTLGQQFKETFAAANPIQKALLLKNLSDGLGEQVSLGNIGLSFDFKELLGSKLGDIVWALSNSLISGNKIGFSTPQISTFMVDINKGLLEYHQESQGAAPNLVTVKGGNEHSSNLTKDYWGSIRRAVGDFLRSNNQTQFSKVVSEIIPTATASPTVEPTATATLTPTPSPVATQTPPPTSTPETKPTKTPVPSAEALKMPERKNFYSELLKPLLKAIYERREQRAANDPEFFNRVDLDLNKDRINLVLFTYGDTHEPPETERAQIGSYTIFSLNTKTGQVDQIAWTHDLRAPEVEEALREKGALDVKPTKIDKAYEVGGTDLMEKVIENATGLIADEIFVSSDEILAKGWDQIFGSLGVDVPKDFTALPIYLNDKKYGSVDFKKGEVGMDGKTMVHFIKSVPQMDEDPIIEHNARKHLVVESALKNMAVNFFNGEFWQKVDKFLETAFKSGIDSNLDVNVLRETISHIRGSVISAAVTSLMNRDFPLPHKGAQIYIVDVNHAKDKRDGVISWVGGSTNSVVQDELKRGVYEDLATEVPLGGNPYAENLADDYYGSIRDLIREKLPPA